jgi:hypothetical protein
MVAAKVIQYTLSGRRTEYATGVNGAAVKRFDENGCLINELKFDHDVYIKTAWSPNQTKSVSKLSNGRVLFKQT